MTVNHIDPAVWEQRAMRVALADRDVSKVYNLLIAACVSQRQIADATGQSQRQLPPTGRPQRRPRR